MLSNPAAFTTSGQQQSPLVLHTLPVERIAAVVLLPERHKCRRRVLKEGSQWPLIN